MYIYMIVDLFYIFLSLQPQLVYQVILRPFIFSRLLKPSLIQLVVYRSFSRCFWIKLPRRPRSGLVILKTFHSFVLQVNLHHFAILDSIKLILSFKPLSGFSTRILFYILYFHPVNLVLYPTYNYFRNLNLMLGNSFLYYVMNYILSLINKFLFNQIIQAEIKINVGHATFAQRK